MALTHEPPPPRCTWWRPIPANGATPSDDEAVPNGQLPGRRFGEFLLCRRSGSPSTESCGREGDDERPRDDTAEIAPDERFHIVEQTNSVGLLHHLSTRV